MNRYYEKLKPYYRVDQSKREGGDETMPESEGVHFVPAGSLPIDRTLQFESRFESGNLRKVMKVGTYEYELYLKNDYGTHSCT